MAAGAPEGAPSGGASRLYLVARVGQLIASDRPIEEILQRAADLIHDELAYPNVDIPLLDPADPNSLVVRVRGGGFKQRIRHEDRVPVAAGIMGAAVRERRTVNVPDVGADPRYVPPPSGLSSRSELAVPILLGEQVLGVLNVEGYRPFDEDDAETLEIIAGFLAVAIRHAELATRAQELTLVEERKRLARELHDSVTQLLFSAKLVSESLAVALRRDPAEGERRIARLTELLAGALAEMRALLRELRPVEEHHLLTVPSGEFPLPAAARVRRQGLAVVLAERVREIGRDGVDARFDGAAWLPQPVELEEALLPIALELLANAVKHARAGRIALRLASGGKGPELEVEDDGAGFDPGAPGVGLGLVALRERVAALGGTLVLDSAPGRGTRARVRLPASAGGAAPR